MKKRSLNKETRVLHQYNHKKIQRGGEGKNQPYYKLSRTPLFSSLRALSESSSDQLTMK